jgi:2-polyprenyl-3-methyl-5-hydroxy-6-metoxy-1,4-benzoquinol methylase
MFIMEAPLKRFDQEALNWDKQPFIQEITRRVAETVRNAIYELETSPGERKNFKCMEFGCGTGLLSSHLADELGEVYGVDASEGMIEQFSIKAETHKNMKGKSCMHFVDGR